MNEIDVAIVGSGPYALSLAAQLRAGGVEHRIFGPPMKFWRDQPAGLNLKSLAFATSLYVPSRGHTFPEWCRDRGLEDFEPCSMASFASYGTWMQERFVPDLEPTEVANVSSSARGFELTLASTEHLVARRVVFATGLSRLAHVPEILRDLPRALASHTSEHRDYAWTKGKDVAVIGAGASAVEAGALVYEAGGRAQILVRDTQAIIHARMDPKSHFFKRMRHPISVLGPGRKNWVIEKFPLAIRLLPESRRLPLIEHYLGPSSPWWIRDRIEGKVEIRTHSRVVAAYEFGSRVRLTLEEQDGARRTLDVDHVIAGTGYTLDLGRLEYLADPLRAQMVRIGRAPALSLRFESSVRGAYFLGPISSASFGPLFRFVCGAEYAAPALARSLAGPRRAVAGMLRRIRWGESRG